MDRIKQMLDTIAELNDDQVIELQDAIIAEFETVEGEDPTPETVEKMTALADMLDTVRDESKRRAAQAEELAARAAEAAYRVKGMKEETVEGDDMDDAPEAPEAEAEETPAEDEDEKEGMMAAAEATSNETEVEAELSTEEQTTDSEVEAELSTEETVQESEVETELSTEDTTQDSEVEAELSTEESQTTEVAAEEAAAEEAVVATADPEEGEAEGDAEGETEAAVTEAAVAEVEPEAEAATELATEEAAEEVETEGELSTSETNEIAQDEQEGQEAPMTAAAEEGMNVDVQAPADRRPVQSEEAAAPVVITAGADIPGYTAGAEIRDSMEVAEAFASRLHGLRRVKGGDGEQHIVASFTTKYPEARVLNQDIDSNIAKINELTAPEALVASGGHSTPFEVKYDIFGFGVGDRPVRDSLPRFQADRGGIRYITAPALSSYANAVGVWTNADDIAASSTKDSLTVSAATEVTKATDAVTLQLQFGNLMTRAYPELIARHNELGLIQHAREAEQAILSAITTDSTAVTTSSLIGVARDFLVNVGRAASAYRSRHRLDASMPLRVIAPYWIKDAMIADLAIAAPGDGTLDAAGEVDGYLASRNVNVTWSHDLNVSGAQSAGAMNEFADTFTWYIFAEGTFLFLDGGTLDLGIIRDSTLVGTNDYKMFVETFEGVAKVGVESLVVTSTIAVNGVAAALRDTTGGATAAAIEY